LSQIESDVFDFGLCDDVEEVNVIHTREKQAEDNHLSKRSVLTQILRERGDDGKKDRDQSNPEDSKSVTLEEGRSEGRGTGDGPPCEYLPKDDDSGVLAGEQKGLEYCFSS